MANDSLDTARLCREDVIAMAGRAGTAEALEALKAAAAAKNYLDPTRQDNKPLIAALADAHARVAATGQIGG